MSEAIVSINDLEKVSFSMFFITVGNLKRCVSLSTRVFVAAQALRLCMIASCLHRSAGVAYFFMSVDGEVAVGCCCGGKQFCMIASSFICTASNVQWAIVSPDLIE